MAKKIIKAQMKQRRDTQANWAAKNPVLLAGELGIVSDDPNLYKVGDGVTAWNALPFRGFDGTVVHTTGSSETAVMSQKGVTEKFTELSESSIPLFSEFMTIRNVGEYSDQSGQPSTHVKYDGRIYELRNDEAVTIGDSGPFKYLATLKDNGRTLLIAATPSTAVSLSTHPILWGRLKPIPSEITTAMLSVTHAELVALRDNGQLIAGMQYRITDYVTTTAQEITRSAGHRFDVIVTADNANTLNEVARACRSEFDIEKYKDAYSCSWAEHMSYVGIYEYEGKEYHLYESEAQDLQMLMDFNSSNVLVNEDALDYPYAFTPTYGRQKEEAWGEWITGQELYESIAFKYNLAEDTYFFGSKLEAWQIWYSLDNDTERFAWADETNGKGVIYRMIDEWGNDVPYDFKNIIYVPLKSFVVEQYGVKHTYTENGDIVNLNGVDYYGYVRTKTASGPPPPPETLFVDVQTLSLDMNLYTGPEMTLYTSAEVIEILPVSEVSYYTFSAGNVGESPIDTSYDGQLVSNNVIKPYRKELKTYINSIIFIGRCHNNVIGFNCHDISFMAQAEAYSQNNLNNIIGNECHSITFKGGAGGNRLGNNCHDIEFGIECKNNNIGNGCYEILFDSVCYYNTLGYNCHNITLGNNDASNDIANGSSVIKFGINVAKNSIGVQSSSITIGNNGFYNIFEGGNSDIEIPENSSSNRFEMGVSSITVEIVREGVYFTRYCIKRGMTSDYIITVTEDRSYETTVAIDSSGNVKQFCMADIASKVDEITITVDE